ncbi:hypothetical protein PMAYCL1PPCAC_17594, partial [Pristionchus mayeri]
AAAAAAAAGGAAAPAAPSPHFGQQPATNAQGVPIATQTAPGQVRPLSGYAPSMSSMGMMQQSMMMTPGGSQPMPLPSPNMGAAGGGGTTPHVQRVGTPVTFGQLQGMQHPVICVPNPMINNQTSVIRIESMLTPIIEMIHDEKVRSTPFIVGQEMMNRLLNDPSLEVHIRSWGRNDKSCKIVWHSIPDEFNCEIRLNGETLKIVHQNKPIIVDKGLLRVDENRLEIIEKSCVCLASFGMAVVERFPLQEALNRVFALPSNCETGKDVDRNKAKMREFISHESANGQIRLPLFCLKTRIQLRVPARSIHCSHASCFDLESVLGSGSGQDSGIYECPVCSAPFRLAEVELDHFVASILKETYQRRPLPLEVMLDQSCNWQAIPREESQARFNSFPHPYPHYGMQPMQQMQQMQQHPMSFPSFPTMGMQQPQQMPLQQLQPTQMNGRKRESSETGGTALKRFKSESFVNAPSGRSPASMMAPHSVASSMMMGGPSTPMGGGMYGGPPSAPMMHQSIPNMTSPFPGVHPSPIKEPSSHHSHVAASPMGSGMAPSTPYGSGGMGGMNGGMGGMNQTALTCATDGGHAQPTSSAPYTPGSVDNKCNGMTTVAASGAGPLSNPQMRAPSAALTPDTQASTSNASAEDESPLRDSLSSIEGLFLSQELNLHQYLMIVGSIDQVKQTEDFAVYNFDTPPSSLPSLPPPQNNEAWNDALSVCGVPSSA